MKGARSPAPRCATGPRRSSAEAQVRFGGTLSERAHRPPDRFIPAQARPGHHQPGAEWNRRADSSKHGREHRSSRGRATLEDRGSTRLPFQRKRTLVALTLS